MNREYGATITNTGGDAPNVVQAYAESLYLVRSPHLPDAERLFERVKKIAEGAGLMTETSVSVQITDATSNVVPNRALQEAVACPCQASREGRATHASRLTAWAGVIARGTKVHH